MPWVKLDDSFWANPKVEDVGNEAAGAYCRMLSYCGQHLTDGFIKDAAARYITTPRVCKKLEKHGFIERQGKGWLIPDYLDFNPSKEKKEEERAKAQERMEKLRREREERKRREEEGRDAA